MREPEREDGRIRVLLVEDHPVVAEGIAAMLEDYPDLTIVGSVGSVGPVAAAVSQLSVDVALIDFRLPDGTGADAAGDVRAGAPSAGIVFLSGDDSDEIVLAAIEVGASSYLLKSAQASEIVDAIRSAARGEIIIPAEKITSALVRDRINARQRARQVALLGRLTPREREVLTHMIGGADNRTVADRLTISYATVRTHVRSILSKLEARSRLEAVARATDAEPPR